jgi:uncharacterized protein (DUF362 family)
MKNKPKETIYMSKVAVIQTKPGTVIRDYERVMELAEFNKALPAQNKTIIKINLSWSHYYPSCSTEPWQLEGVLGALKKHHYKDLLGVENQTVVTHPWKGAYNNKWLPILGKYGVKYQPLTDVEWVEYKPNFDLLGMNDLFNKILIPKLFKDTNILHLPTVKTHGHTTTTGAIKNAFGGLIPKYRHHSHRIIHEVLVDLLAIQNEIHKGAFAVMDGTVCGNGAGPRVMEPFIGNVILASDDMVAIDSVAAKLMGFDPMKIDYLKLSHDRCLGNADIDQIEILGLDEYEFNAINFKFNVKKSMVIRWDQRLRNRTPTDSRLHKLLFHSPIFKTLIFASEFYHDWLWYPLIGKSRIKQFSGTDWGRLFDRYEYGKLPDYTEVKNWDPY